MRIDSPNWAEELGEVRKLFAAQLQRMKIRAGEIGLFATMQALDEVTLVIGFELANDLAGLEKYRRQRNGYKLGIQE